MTAWSVGTLLDGGDGAHAFWIFFIFLVPSRVRIQSKAHPCIKLPVACAHSGSAAHVCTNAAQARGLLGIRRSCALLPKAAGLLSQGSALGSTVRASHPTRASLAGWTISPFQGSQCVSSRRLRRGCRAHLSPLSYKFLST